MLNVCRVSDLVLKASAALAGIAGGPLILAPLKYVFGRPSVIFWALLGSIGCGIWAACMTGANDYIPFVMSRLLSGIFGSLPSTVGASMILDTFFLHQRGRAFVCYAISTAFGVIAAPTFGGFIVSTQKWPVCFWWTVALQGLAACLVLFFLEETGFDHHTGADKKPANNYLKDRATLFFPGTRNTHGIGQGSFVSFVLIRAISRIVHADPCVEKICSCAFLDRFVTMHSDGRTVHHVVLWLESAAQCIDTDLSPNANFEGWIWFHTRTECSL